MSYGAVLLDVCRVFLVPHGDPVASAFADVGIGIGETDFVRSHYSAIAGKTVLPGIASTCLGTPTGYVETLGVRAEDRSRATDALVTTWRTPSVDVGRQVLSKSVRGLQRLAARNIQLGRSPTRTGRSRNTSDATASARSDREWADVAIIVDSS